jgi:hypothetical protein
VTLEPPTDQDRRTKRYLIIGGVILLLFFIAQILGDSTTTRTTLQPQPAVTVTVTKTAKPEPPRVITCAQVVRRTHEYEAFLDVQAAAAGRLDQAGDDMLYAMASHDRTAITDTTTKYHEVYSTYVDATRDVLSSADAVRFAVAGCSSQRASGDR